MSPEAISANEMNDSTNLAVGVTVRNPAATERGRALWSRRAQ